MTFAPEAATIYGFRASYATASFGLRGRDVLGALRTYAPRRRAAETVCHTWRSAEEITVSTLALIA